MKNLILLLVVLLVLGSCAKRELSNEMLTFRLDQTGKQLIKDRNWSEEVVIDSTRFSLTIDGKDYRSESMVCSAVLKTDFSETRIYEADGYKISLVSELKPDWRFISRQVFVESSKGDVFKVNRIVLLRFCRHIDKR